MGLPLPMTPRTASTLSTMEVETLWLGGVFLHRATSSQTYDQVTVLQVTSKSQVSSSPESSSKVSEDQGVSSHRQVLPLNVSSPLNDTVILFTHLGAVIIYQHFTSISGKLPLSSWSPTSKNRISLEQNTHLTAFGVMVTLRWKRTKLRLLNPSLQTSDVQLCLWLMRRRLLQSQIYKHTTPIGSPTTGCVFS